MLVIIIITVAISCLLFGFKAAEYIYKKEASLKDEKECELFENKD